MYVATYVGLSRTLSNGTMQETVSSRAKAVIGYEATQLNLAHDQPADFVLFDKMESGWECRKSVVEVVYDAGPTRQTVFRGRVSLSKV